MYWGGYAYYNIINIKISVHKLATELYFFLCNFTKGTESYLSPKVKCPGTIPQILSGRFFPFLPAAHSSGPKPGGAVR